MKSVILALLISLGLSSCQELPAFAKTPQTQTASWYDTASCLREHTSGWWTASGERFNENALTAASWDYPFGTRLRVINQNSHKWVEVVINDRGPAKRLYRKGRILDLSKKSFESISPLSVGVIPISIEVENG